MRWGLTGDGTMQRAAASDAEAEDAAGREAGGHGGVAGGW
jgi:hypothetical protein